MQDEIYKYNQTEFCKVKEECRKTHKNIMCENPEVCLGQTFSKGHPKECNHFTKSGSCRHNEKCAYKHTHSINYSGQTG